MNKIIKELGQLLVGLGIVVLAVAALASSGGVGVTADEALRKLQDGNKRYVGNQLNTCKESSAAKRESLAKGQKPYAIILSCSDSRVPPEIIFDKTLGEIFVIRVAGNIPDAIVLGSIEYAVEHIGSPLIMILGHERCGAVTAAVQAKSAVEGNIGAIVKTIAPAVVQAKKEAKGKSDAELVEAAVNASVRLVARNVVKQSLIIAKLVKEGKVKILTAKYDLDDGIVSLLEK